VRQSIDAAQYRDPATEISETIEPALKWVSARPRQVVLDVGTHIRF